MIFSHAALVLLLSSSAPAAEQPSKRCDAGDVTTITVSSEVEKWSEDLGSPGARELEVQSVTQPSASEPNAPADQTVHIVAVGPVLGPMDSAMVTTAVSCEKKGIELTATVTRASAFNGSVAANVNWRARIDFLVLVRQRNVTVELTWKMRSTAGAELSRAQTPPYPSQRFPMKVRKTVYAHPTGNRWKR